MLSCGVSSFNKQYLLSQSSKQIQLLTSNLWCLFRCSGLATLGIDVSLVSTSSPKTKNKQGMWQLYNLVMHFRVHRT